MRRPLYELYLKRARVQSGLSVFVAVLLTSRGVQSTAE